MRAETETYLKKVLETIEGLRGYWPLTLRQIYYQLVAGLVIGNDINQYKKLSRVLTQARMEGLCSWEAIEDRSRVILQSGGWADAGSFKEDQMMDFLSGYRRDLLKTQDVRLEVWVEKDALSHILHKVCLPYCIPVIAARGFSSTTFKRKCYERVVKNSGNRQKTKILYFGDLDPSGWEMLPSMMKTLQDEMELWDEVEGIRVALSPRQVEEYDLPISLDAIKEKDPRAKKYRKQFGGLAVELDALPPNILEGIATEAIESNLDLSKFEEEERIEEQEIEILEEAKGRVSQLMAEQLDF